MKPPLLLLHGVGCGADSFDALSPLLEERGWTCRAHTLFPELRRTDLPPDGLCDLSFSDYRAQCRDWASELEREYGAKPVAVGHSMGGLLAACLAAEDNVSAAVLLTPASPKGVGAFSLAALRTFWPVMRVLPKLANTPVKLSEGGFLWGVANGLDEETARAAYAGARFDSGRVYKDIFDGIPLDLSQIRVPVLTVCAERDRATVPKAVKRFASALAREANPPGQLIEIEDAPHWIVDGPHLERLAEDVSIWLGQALS